MRAFLSTGADSPVKIASSTLKSAVSNNRASAAMRSPASRRRISPATISLAGMMISLPPLSTRAFGAISFSMASMAFSERYSWTKPITAFRATIAPIANASVYVSSTTRGSAAACDS